MARLPALFMSATLFAQEHGMSSKQVRQRLDVGDLPEVTKEMELGQRYVDLVELHKRMENGQFQLSDLRKAV